MDESYLEWLTSIPGSDAERARKIAERFPTYDQLRTATCEELASVDGLTTDFVEALRGLLGGSPRGEEAEHLFLCPECGSFVGTATTACPFCGVEFGGSTESHLAAAFDEFLQEESPGRICVACGAGMGREETACPVCGRQYGPSELALLPGIEPHLDESAPFCSRCGAYLSSAESECAICGSSVTPGRDSTPAAKGVVKDFLTRWQRIAPADTIASEADRLAEELVHFDRLLEANPTLERAWANRAKVLEKLGRTKEAAESLAKAAELNPAKEDHYRLEVQNILKTTNDAAVVAPRWTQPAATAAPKVLDPHILEALDHYESLLRADPSLIVAWRTKAEILDRLGRADEARLSLAEADRLEHVDVRSARAAIDGLQSTGLAASGPGRTGRTNGQVNGTRSGRTNGRVNGIAGGRVNGLTTGAANGLTFGRGATNGLVNGNGFTNGRRGRHPIPRIPPQPHWSRSVIGIAAVVALMVIVPILASMLSPAPTGGPLIRIDGSFGDWAKFPAYAQSPADSTPNPGVHLLAVKVASQDRDLFVYVKVQGLMFQGTGVNETDSIFAFVDEDNSRTTGYPIGDLGADSLVEVTGWRDLSSVRHQVTSYVFNETSVARSNDWNRFLPSGSTEAAFNGPELEIRVTVRDPARARVLVYAADNLGNFDPSDGSIRASLPTVIIGQQTVAKDIVASARVPFLRLTLGPMGGVPHVSGINLTRLGTSLDPVDLALYRDNGSGVFNTTDPLLATATMMGTTVRLNVSQDLSGPALYWVETRWTNRTSTTTFGLAVADVATNGTASFRPPETSLVYLGAAPATPRVDGAFGDWQGRPYGQDPLGDVRNVTGAISPAYDANVDMVATAVHVASNFTGYVRVDGRMLGGQDIPTVRVRTYPLPPSNNTTLPGPIPPQEGVDVVYAYFDSDNSTTTGFQAVVEGRQYGFDYAIAIVGRNGEIRSQGIYTYVSGSTGPWRLIGSAGVGFDAHRMEFAVNASVLNLTAGYRVVYYTSDWRLQYDVALPDSAVAVFPISVQAATNVVINEVVSRPNPKWVELANPTSSSVSLSGWNLVRVRGGNRVTVLFTFTNQVLGAWGSASGYLRVNLPSSSLPTAGATVALRRGTTEIDRTTYPGTLTNTQSWSRFKDPVTGIPMDTNNDAMDFYASTVRSPGQPNDRHRPTIIVTKVASRAIAAPGNSITYTVYYNNTNTGMAKNVWINDTLPSGVTYISSSVAYQSNTGSTYRWTFTNVMPGPHSFTVLVQVTAGTTSGQRLTNAVTLDYTDQLRRPFPQTRAWANTTVSRPLITVVKTVNPSSAKAGDLVTFTIYYNNTGNAAASTVTIKDNLPVGLDYRSASPAPTWTNGRTFYWNFTNVAPGPHSLTLTARVNASFSGKQLVNWAFSNYTTAGGYALFGGSSSVIVAIPELSDMLFVAAVPMVILGLKFRARRRQKE